jgi:hypothetical protein
MMSKRTPGPWFVKKKDEAVGIIGSDASLVAVMRRKKGEDNTRLSDADLIAAAPLLLDVCQKIKEILENNFIVTAEGFKINDAHIRESLLNAIMSAEGYRKKVEKP